MFSLLILIMIELYHTSMDPFNVWEDFVAREKGDNGVVTITTFKDFFAENANSEFDNLWHISTPNVGDDFGKACKVYYPSRNSTAYNVLEFIVQDKEDEPYYTVVLSNNFPFDENSVNLVLFELNYIFDEEFVYRNRSHKYRMKLDEEIVVIEEDEGEFSTKIKKDNILFFDYTEDEDSYSVVFGDQVLNIEKNKVNEFEIL